MDVSRVLWLFFVLVQSSQVTKKVRNIVLGKHFTDTRKAVKKKLIKEL